MNKIITQSTTKTGKTISFRYPTINDAEILKNFINKISAEKSFILMQGEQKTLVQEKKWLKDKIEKINKKECVYLLGFIDQELVACSEITLESMAKNHVGEFGITVAKNCRGEGIGKVIMELNIKEAIKNIKTLKIIILECFAINNIAFSLYQKFGFKEYGRLPQGLKRRGQFIDSVLMYKKVR